MAAYEARSMSAALPPSDRPGGRRWLLLVASATTLGCVGLLLGVMVTKELAAARDRPSSEDDAGRADASLHEAVIAATPAAREPDGPMDVLHGLVGNAPGHAEAMLTRRMQNEREDLSAILPRLDLREARVLLRRPDSVQLEVPLRADEHDPAVRGRARLRLLKDDAGWKLDHVRVEPKR